MTILEGLSPTQVQAVTAGSAVPLAVVAGPGAGKTPPSSPAGSPTGAPPARRDAPRSRPHLDVHPARRSGDAASPRPVSACDGACQTGDHGRRRSTASPTPRSERWRAEHGLPQISVLSHPARLVREAMEVVGRIHVPSPGTSMTWSSRSPWPAGPAVASTDARSGAAYAQREAGEGRHGLRRPAGRRCARIVDDDPASRPVALPPCCLSTSTRTSTRPTSGSSGPGSAIATGPLCLVGDPGQAIYGFNGAVDDLFGRVATDWPGARIVVLDANFRSTPEVVAAARAVHATAASARHPGPIPTVRGFASTEDEAEAVADSLIGARHGGRNAVAVHGRPGRHQRSVSKVVAFDA